MSMNLIIANIIGFIAFVVTLIAYHRATKKKIFENMIFANNLDVIHYLVLGAYSGCITKVIALIRNFVIIKKEKYEWLSSKVILILFIILYVVSGILSFTNIFSIFCIVAAIIYLIWCWNGNELQVKRAAFYCYFLWLIYNSSVQLYAGIISNVVSIISTFIALRNEKRNIKNEVGGIS